MRKLKHRGFSNLVSITINWIQASNPDNLTLELFFTIMPDDTKMTGALKPHGSTWHKTLIRKT